jgi:sterol desaturase/sphingolipid hydroxylase (fatty acid hydroxylase superfamily)
VCHPGYINHGGLAWSAHDCPDTGGCESAGPRQCDIALPLGPVQCAMRYVRRDGSRVLGRLRWPSVLIAICFLAVVVTFGLWSSTPRHGLPIAGDTNLDALAQFCLAVYRTQNFQVLALVLLVASAIEAVVPARRQASHSRAFNIPYGCMMLLFDSVVAPLPIFIADALAQRFGLRSVLDLSFDASGSIARSCAAVVIGVALADFFQYWFHRLQHSRLLWPQHAVHHSDTALDVTTTQRAHVLDHLFLPIAITVPMALFFDLPGNDIVVLSVLPSLWPYMIHTNIRLGFGRAWWLLTSPQYHRIHHSAEPQHRDRNFALWLPLWDIVFGTAYVPRPREYPATGVSGIEICTTSQAFLYPFQRWYAMLLGCAEGLFFNRS